MSIFVKCSTHLSCIQAMVSHGRVELLAHPLSQKYLQCKWNTYGKYFHVTNLIIYSVFLLFVTLYASELITTINQMASSQSTAPSVSAATTYDNATQVNVSVIFTTVSPLHIEVFQSQPIGLEEQMKSLLAALTNANALRSYHSDRPVLPNVVEKTEQDTYIHVTPLMYICGIAIVTYIASVVIRELFQIHQQKWQYLLEPNNFISWVLCISAGITISPVFTGGYINDLHFTASSITVFLSWFNLLLFLQRFDQVHAHSGNSRIHVY